MKKSVFYAVRVGYRPGIYKSWSECEAQVKNFKNSVFKKFDSLKEAESFIEPNEGMGEEEIKLKGFHLYTDGGSRGNPGLGGCGAVLYQGMNKVASCYHFLGYQVSNNVAEYHGVLYGLVLAHTQKAKRLKVFSDSNLIVNQLKGTWQISHPDMQKLNELVKRSLKDFSGVTFQYIPREKNKEADQLCNLAMDLGLNR